MQSEAVVMTTEEFIAKLESLNHKYNSPLVVKAFEIANNLHKGQLRKSGEPYIIHPIAVSFILANFGMDTETIVAGLMHDVVEDTGFSIDDIEYEFGKDVAFLVEGVTKLGKIKYKSHAEQQAGNHRKMLLAMQMIFV